nr:Multidrug resistance-associated protein 4 [Polyrhizophydium stewartii]
MVPLWCDIKTMRGSDFGAATAADDEDKDDDSPHVAHIPKLLNGLPSDLSLDIQPGEKVGVVGRTGSGKLTLMTALFRIMEASKGSIAIDGIDIASLGLKTLRSRLQIIPQEPVLFKGTVRSNLDFATKYTDDELWAALGLVGLKDFVGTLDGKLDAAIEENGANLSMGQRQLMCLCKAILAKPKVLIMDEATASVDAEADRRIQESIETQFAATTVLSIAHRLNTIAAFDRVLVLDGGRIAEFDAPHVRLGRSGSVFGDMVDATGAANAAVIRQIAADHFAVTYRDLASQSFSTIA